MKTLAKEFIYKVRIKRLKKCDKRTQYRKLVMAIDKGDKTFVEKAMSEIKTININAADGIFLITACTSNKLDIVKYLVENGANISVRDDMPIFIAIDNENSELFAYLFDRLSYNFVKISMLIAFAIERDNPQILQHLFSGLNTSKFPMGYFYDMIEKSNAIKIQKYLEEVAVGLA